MWFLRDLPSTLPRLEMTTEKTHKHIYILLVFYEHINPSNYSPEFIYIKKTMQIPIFDDHNHKNSNEFMLLTNSNSFYSANGSKLASYFASPHMQLMTSSNQ